MEQIEALQHLSCNVDAGYFPQRGAGFQTVALSEALLHSEDLPLLQDMASYYEVSASCRGAGDLPVREMLFRLPSGRLALGRTQDWGTGPTGRSGNYLAYQLVLPAEAVQRHPWDPFGLLDAAFSAAAADLTPRTLSPIQVSAACPKLGEVPEIPAGLLASLIQDLLAFTVPVLLIAPEPLTRRLISGLLYGLPAEERATLTFSTHFYRACHAQRSAFQLVAVASNGEAPAERSAYRAYDLVDGASDSYRATSSMADWLAGALRSGMTDEIDEVRSAVDGLRAGVASEQLPYPRSHAGMTAVWDRVGVRATGLLLKRLAQLPELLRASPAAREMADALLRTASPDELGTEATAAIQGAATPSTWGAWVRKWRKHPAVSGLARPRWAWWQR